MSRFTRAAAAMQTLTLAAMEETSRYGSRDADIEHLFLALTLDADTGGQVLRSLGVTLDSARSALDEERAAQIGALGISMDAADAAAISFHETGGYDWTDRAMAVFTHAAKGGRTGDSAAVLRTIIDEPSGQIESLLRRLDLTRSDVERRLDAVDRLPRRSAPAAHELRRTHEAFVPAPPSSVRVVLADPARIPEWDPMLVEISPTDDGWDARTRTVRPDGTPIGVRADLRRQHVTRIPGSDDHIGWRFSYPDSSTANARLVTFSAEKAAGGTQLRIDLGWERRSARRPVIAFLLRPLFRFMLFMQLTQISSGVTRVFR